MTSYQPFYLKVLQVGGCGCSITCTAEEEEEDEEEDVGGGARMLPKGVPHTGQVRERSAKFHQ